MSLPPIAELIGSRRNREKTEALLRQEITALKQPLDGFKRPLFGQKSERRLEVGANGQRSLGEWLTQPTLPEPHGRLMAAHLRKPVTRRNDDEAVPFFDETRVPVEVIELPAPATDGLSREDYEVISHQESYRLAPRPGSDGVIKYRRPVVKLKKTAELVCASAPAGIIDGSRADVSFIAGLWIDQFADPLPLYRQHPRLTDAGITVSRPWLTQIAPQGIGLLEPIYDAQFASIRASRVKAMDETPIKAGQGVPGKLKAASFWPVYGELDEIGFPFFESREAKHVATALGLSAIEGSVLLSDGYRAYACYVARTGIMHAQCWAHTRRGCFEAQTVEPEAAAQALNFIAQLYEIEEPIRQKKLAGVHKRDERQTQAKPIAACFFAWIDERFEAQGLLPGQSHESYTRPRSSARKLSEVAAMRRWTLSPPLRLTGARRRRFKTNWRKTARL